MNTNVDKKVLSPGGFFGRFLISFITAVLLILIISYPIFEMVKPYLNIQTSTISAETVLYGIAIGILIIEVIFAFATSFISIELSLLNAKINREDAEKSKKYMNIFLIVLAIISILLVLLLYLIATTPILQRYTQIQDGSLISSIFIPLSIIALSFIIYWIILIKQCRKRFNKKVYGDGTNKPQINSVQQVPQQPNTNQNMINTTVTNNTPSAQQPTPVVEPTPAVNNEPETQNNQTTTPSQEMTMDQLYPQETNNTNNNQTN